MLGTGFRTISRRRAEISTGFRTMSMRAEIGIENKAREFPYQTEMTVIISDCCFEKKNYCQQNWTAQKLTTHKSYFCPSKLRNNVFTLLLTCKQCDVNTLSCFFST